MEQLAARPVYSQPHEQLDREVRIRTDTITWSAEMLDGNMRTSFEFLFDGQELYGNDEGALTEVFDDAVQEAEIIAQQNPSLLFELRRRLIERGELDDMKAMGRGELYTEDGKPVNTMVVVSDFPPELMDSKQDVGGYNTNRKQTMLRIITLEADGIMRVTTQSLDESNRQALEAVYGALGEQPEAGELLSQRVNLNLAPEWQPTLIDNLTAAYDNSMGEQYGGKWYAGRQPVDKRNTYDFVHNQQDVIDWFTAEKLADPVGAERLRFKLGSVMRARYKRYLAQNETAESALDLMEHRSVVSTEAIMRGQNLVVELERESKRAASRGETFSGCGATVTAESELSSEDQLRVSGLGNKSKSSDEECEFVSKECPSCHTKNVKTKVTKHRITGSCGCSKTR